MLAGRLHCWSAAESVCRGELIEYYCREGVMLASPTSCKVVARGSRRGRKEDGEDGKFHLKPGMIVPTAIGAEKPTMSKGVEEEYMHVLKRHIRWNHIMPQAVVTERRLASTKKRALSDLVIVICASRALTCATSVSIDILFVVCSSVTSR
jgi:hypothetical protein